MTTRILFGAALLGVASCLSARAQAPRVSSPSAATVAPAPAPGQAPADIMARPVPANATNPTSPESASPMYTNGMPPARNIDAGTQRADQPVYGNGKPAIPGSYNTRSINRKRTATTTTTNP
ncbi:MAG: hypothetical protein ACRYG7_04775 [Janthinobacterium lividum]